jgi:Enoyl-(Acyl carrier protein) reductase
VRLIQVVQHIPLVRLSVEDMEVIPRGMKNDTMLKNLPLMDEIANTAVFLASDFAKSITGVTIDVTGGTTAGLNYRVGSSADQGAGRAPPAVKQRLCL